MKTQNYFRNAAMILMMVLPASFTFSQGENENAENLRREKAEFAKAGYWIDAVVVTGIANKQDRDLLAGKGYYIEPVVVTYNHKTDVPHANAYLTNIEVSTSSASDKKVNTLQVSQLNEE